MALTLNNDLTLALVIKAKSELAQALGKDKRELQQFTDAAERAGAGAAQSFGRVGTAADQSASRIRHAYEILGLNSRQAIEREMKLAEAAYQRLAATGKLSAAEQQRAFEALQGKLRALRGELDGGSRGLQGFIGRVGQLNALAAGAGIATLAAGFKSVVEAGMELESTFNALAQATGSTQAAGAALSFVDAEAKRLGINLQRSQKDFTNLAAAAKGTKLEGEGIQKVFSGISEAAVVTGRSADETSGIILALTQMLSKGTVQAEELTGQLGERLPGALQTAARAMNMSTSELLGQIQKGQVKADEFVARFADQLHKEMAERLPAATRTARAELARFNGELFKLKATMGTTLLPVVTDLIRGLGFLINNVVKPGIWVVQMLGMEFAKTFADVKTVIDGVISLDFSGIWSGLTQNNQIMIEQMNDNWKRLNDLGAAAGAAGAAVDAATGQMTAGLQNTAAATAMTAAQLKQLGADTTEALDPATKAVDSLSQALKAQAEQQAALRAKVFEATGGAASGYVTDQLRALREEVAGMLQANIGQGDVAAYYAQQVAQLEQRARAAGALVEAANLESQKYTAAQAVSDVALEVSRASSETDALKQKWAEAQQAISDAGLALRKMLPAEEAQAVQARLDALRTQLAGIGQEANIEAHFDTAQASREVARIQNELAAIPREIVTHLRIVRSGEGSAPAAPSFGSRATGGEIPRDGMYQLHAGERVVSSSSQTFGDINVYGGGGLPADRAQLRAWVRGVLIPELQAAGR